MKSRALPTALLALTLAGCATDQQGMTVNRSLNNVHQPVVQRTDFTFDVTHDGYALGPNEANRLAGWFDSLRVGYGDAIYVDDASASPEVRAGIARVAGAYGLLLSASAPQSQGAVQPGYARVIVSRTTASVPGCPDFRQANNLGAPISTPSNFGCATSSNLAAMIADPNDLVRGRSSTAPGDAATASKAIKVYRDAKPTGAEGLASSSTKETN